MSHNFKPLFFCSKYLGPCKRISYSFYTHFLYAFFIYVHERDIFHFPVVLGLLVLSTFSVKFIIFIKIYDFDVKKFKILYVKWKIVLPLNILYLFKKLFKSVFRICSRFKRIRILQKFPNPNEAI